MKEVKIFIFKYFAEGKENDTAQGCFQFFKQSGLS
jgi:hypothetical protein